MMVTSDSGPDGESSPGAESRRATITATGPDGTMRVIDLAPQRILVESPLASKLRPNSGLSASRESADRLAQETGGRWQPIYGLEDLPMPPGMMPPELNQLVWKSGDPGDGPGGSTASGSMEAVARQHRFDRLDRLTPEQRAREAAASPGPGMQFDVDIDVR
jgi:hypothetical protein